MAEITAYCDEWSAWIRRDVPDDEGPAEIRGQMLLRSAEIRGQMLLRSAVVRLGEMHLAQESRSEMHRRAQKAERQANKLRRRLRALASTARHFAELDAPERRSTVKRTA